MGKTSHAVEQCYPAVEGFCKGIWLPVADFARRFLVALSEPVDSLLGARVGQETCKRERAGGAMAGPAGGG